MPIYIPPAPGPKGDKGDPGEASTVPGPASTTPGPQGIQGPAGADSTVPGPQGIQGPAGAASTTPGPQGPAGAASTVPGPQGIQGAAGPGVHVYNQTTEPGAAVAGDIWINTAGADPVWTPYTPVLTASTTSPTLGSGGTLAGSYYQLGKLVFYEFRLFWGSTAGSAGSGEYHFTLPVAAVSSAAKSVGSGTFGTEASPYVAAAVLISAANIRVNVANSISSQWLAQNLPSANVFLYLSGFYEAA